MFFILEKFLFDLGPILFAMAGLALAGYVYFKKNKKEVLVCPMNGSCDEVVNSKYSHFMGVPVEVAGMAYYAIIILSYSYIFLSATPVSDVFKFFVTGLTIGAFLFSCYLVFIQAFILKKWCTWCLFSAGFSTFIFVTAVFGADFSLVALLIENKKIIVFFHALAAAIGVGAATITDIFFFRFLKDYKISESEYSVMETLSGVIWVALGILVITGAGLFIPESQTLIHSSKFITKVFAIVVLIINGFLLNLVVSPRLMEITFGEEHDHMKGELHFLRKLAFALGAISISSWYVIFFLGSLRAIPISGRLGIVIYVSVLFLSVIGSQFFDQYMVAKRKKELSSKK